VLGGGVASAVGVLLALAVDFGFALGLSFFALSPPSLEHATTSSNPGIHLMAARVPDCRPDAWRHAAPVVSAAFA